MVAVANGQYIGAGMKIAPHASLDNGLFDVVIIDGMSKMRMLKKLPGLYKGEHINLPEVKVVQGKQVIAFSRDRVLIEVEGEQPGCLDAEFTILNAALDLIC
jgi:diacylglycerol kinase family enzyme